jgi:D-alanyl-lipoteichoic acid acyltransferase DltB (MBOAT superfamily)
LTLGLSAVLILGLAAIVYGAVIPERWRRWVLLIGSIIAVYWLQAPLAPRFADFVLPTLTIGLTIAGWWLSRPQGRALAVGHYEGDDQSAPPGKQLRRNGVVYIRDDWFTLIVVITIILALSLFRYVDPAFRLTASRPPSPLNVAFGIAEAGLILAALAILLVRLPQRLALNGAIGLLVALFILMKWPPALTTIATWWRGFTGQDISLGAPSDLAWLGFSYVIFRLIHTLRDRQAGILPDLPLNAYMTYVLFAPSFVAGPIDRAERFAADFLRLPQLIGLEASRWGDGLFRIGEGLFKKFVLADLLAQGLSLTPALADQTQNPLLLWLLLIGYGLRLYLDFGGYTDIAIGLGILFGIRLPENFNRPYSRSNITAFWQSWHMTLSNWARFYIFTPLSRALLRRRKPGQPTAGLSPTMIVLGSHLATMVVIGLWHGITWTFFIWGVWHATGLFIHKQWSDRTRKWYRGLQDRPWPRRVWAFTGWSLTFVYVMLGWVWFLMPTPAAAFQTFAGLFGWR